MKYYVLIIIAFLPLVTISQSSPTVLPSSGPGALEVAQQRAAYERELALRLYLAELEAQKASQNTNNQGPKNYQPAAPTYPVAYDVINFPMDWDWGKPASAIPSRVNVLQITKEPDGKTLTYTIEARDVLFGNIESTRFWMYYKNDSLIGVQTQVFDPAFINIATKEFGPSESQSKDEKGNTWYIWRKGKTGMSLANTPNGNYVALYRLTQPR